MNLPTWVKPDTSFAVVFGNANDTLWHVRGIVDGLAVCREWWPTKRRWKYEVLDPAFFEVNRNHIKVRR